VGRIIGAPEICRRCAVASDQLKGRQKRRRVGLTVNQGAVRKTGVGFSPTNARGQKRTGNVEIIPVNLNPSIPHALYFKANSMIGCSRLSMLYILRPSRRVTCIVFADTGMVGQIHFDFG
jgi:hypothetical protein